MLHVSFKRNSGKLLHLLRKWEVFNAILLVSRRDEGRPGRLRADRYAVIIDRAKTVLDLAYTETMSVANSAVGDSRATMSAGSYESYGEGQHRQGQQHGGDGTERGLGLLLCCS